MDQTLFRKILAKTKLQVSLLVVIVLFQSLSHAGLLPAESELVGFLQSWLRNWGLPFILLVSLGENLVGFNVYFPGSVVILLSMSLAAGDIGRACLTWLCIFLGGGSGQVIDFLLGRRLRKKRGDKDNALLQQDTRGLPHWREFLLTYWHPHFGAVTSLRSGYSDMPFRRFLIYSFPSLAIWYGFWGIMAYSTGVGVESGIPWTSIFFVYLGVWFGFDVIKVIRTDRK